MAVAALACAAAIGCGGSESTGETTTAALTKKEFLKEGNKICKERLEEKDEVLKVALEELDPSERAEPSAAKLEEVGEQAVQPFQKLADELGQLPAPAGDEAAVERITVELEASLKKAESNLDHLIQTNPFGKASKAAQAYGLEACVF